MMADCEYKEDVLKLMNSLVNILAIVKVNESIIYHSCLAKLMDTEKLYLFEFSPHIAFSK